MSGVRDSALVTRSWTQVMGDDPPPDQSQQRCDSLIKVKRSGGTERAHGRPPCLFALKSGLTVSDLES